MTSPLISCIMPCSRPEDLPEAIRMFKAQDWPNKELLILMDDEGYTKDTSVNHHVWQWGKPGLSIGAKRNELCAHADGNIVCHLDSDDFYAPDYLTQSYTFLKESEADTTGLSSAYFYERDKNLWLYQYRGNQPYVLGSGMMYYKRIWEHNKFKDKSRGEDTIFCANAGRVKPHGYLNGMIAMIHPKNTSSHLELNHMKRMDVKIAEGIIEGWAMRAA